MNFLNKWLQKTSIEQTDFIVLDTETTGYDYKKDKLLSIGAVPLRGKNIFTNNSFERYIKQPKEIYNKESTKIHGILYNSKRYDFVPEKQALLAFKNYIGNNILIGHHIGFDMNMIAIALKNHKVPRLKNNVIDTGILFKRMLYTLSKKTREKRITLDRICDYFDIPKPDRHKALGDAMITAIAFIKILCILNKKKDMYVKDLLKIPFYLENTL